MILTHDPPQVINNSPHLTSDNQTQLDLKCVDFISIIELIQAIIKEEVNLNTKFLFYNKFFIDPLKELKNFTTSDLLVLLSLIQLICYKTNSSNSKIQLFFTDDPLGYCLVFLFIQLIYSSNFEQKSKQNNPKKIQLKELYQKYTEFIKFGNFNALGKSTFLKYLKNLYENQLTTKKTLDGLQIEFSDQLTTYLNQYYIDYCEFQTTINFVQRNLN